MRGQDHLVESISTLSRWLVHLMLESYFPVAFAVVELENKDSWFWFVVPMRNAIVHMEHDLVIIFGRQRMTPYRLYFQRV